MKKVCSLILSLCMLLAMFVPTAAKGNTYIYLRPDNFKDSTGTWTIMENESGAVDLKNLKGRVDRLAQDAVPASAKVDIPSDGEYYVWTHSMDHDTVPGTRNFQVALGEKILPKKLATHGVNGYKWELAGSVTLKAGESFLKLLDTSCYYARCDCVVITDDKDYVPPAKTEDIKSEITKYQPDPSKTSVADTTVPTELGNEAKPPEGYDDSTQPTANQKEAAKTDGKTMEMTVNSLNFFTPNSWGPLSRGTMQGLYKDNVPASATWNPNLAQPVTATVSFYLFLDSAHIDQNDSEMTFEVYYGDGNTDTFVYDATKATSEGWVTIGTYAFTGNGNEFIRFVKTSPKGVFTRIGSVKLEATEGKIVCAQTEPKEPTAPNYKRLKMVQIEKGGTGYFESGCWAGDNKNGVDGNASSVTAAQNAVSVFHPQILENKDVEISVYNNPVQSFGKNPDKQAVYTVVHNGNEEKITFDMSQKEGWYSLGTFAFSGNGNEYVKIEKATGDTSTIVRACGVRFTSEDMMKVSTEAPTMPKGVSFKPVPVDKSILYDETSINDFKSETAYFYPSEASIISYGSDLYKETGNWLNSGLAGYYDTFKQANTSTRYSFDPSAKASWGTGGIKGEAEVSIYKLSHANSDNKARIQVAHNGKTETFYLDFTEGTSGWVSLGLFDFAGTADEGVTLDNEETALTCRANAVRYEQCFVKVQSEQENGKQIQTTYVNTDAFDGLPKKSSKQNVNYETTPELRLDYDYVKDGVRVIIDGGKINIAKKDFIEGNIAVNTNICKMSVPLSEIEIQDGQSFVMEAIYSDKTAQGVIGKAVDFNFYIQNGDEKVAFATKNKPIEVKITADTYDKENTTLVKITDGKTSFIPAFIDNYGAFGEVNGAYTGVTFEEKLKVFQNPVFAMGKINESQTLAIYKGNIQMPDMAGHWAQADVNLMASKGMVYGKGDGYDPESPVTRAEFCTLLLRAIGVDVSNTPSGYKDVSENEWYSPYVSAAKQAGIFDGMPYTDTFEPDKAITRQEMSAMIVNGVKCAGKFKNTMIESSYFLKNFADKDSIAPWAKEFVACATELEIIKGIEKDGVLTFSPEENSTRAQAAVMLKRFMDVDEYVGPLGEGEWELTFHDEFDGDDLNDDVWDSVNGPHGHIASSRYRENVEVHDGKAYLIAKDEDKGGKNWTSASIWTKNFDQTYGYFEAKYKYPNSKSMNYNIAFWLYKSMIHVNNTKYCEIDINEGRMPGTVQTAEHFSDDNMENRSSRYAYQWMTDNYSDGYHIFALEWTEDALIWYVDGREIRRRATTYSNQPMQVYLSTAIMKDATEEELLKDVDGSAMEVEYVRVYQRNK